jgi:acyl-coenzyme A thioesterase PaaI-like protein
MTAPTHDSASGPEHEHELDTEPEAELEAAQGALARAVGELLEASMLTEVDLGEVRSATAGIEAVTRRLRAQARTEPLGATVTAHGGVRNHGNTVVGLRNPMAILRPGQREIEDGVLRYRTHLGPAFEGPPGHVHGGVSALVLDQVLGEAASVFGGPGMTGRLTLHYRRALRLGPLVAEAWLQGVPGSKTVLEGRILDPDGAVCVEAEGLFIFPKWAADHPVWSSGTWRG